jgi:hypothetical protein
MKGKCTVRGAKMIETSLRRHYPDQVLRVYSQPSVIKSTPGNSEIEPQS